MSDRRSNIPPWAVAPPFILLLIYFIADQCFERRPMLEEYVIKVPARGQKIGNEYVPWVLLRDTSGDIVVLQKEDSLEFDFSKAGIINFGRDTVKYRCDATGIDWSKDTSMTQEMRMRELAKQMARNPYFIAGPGYPLPGSLVCHLDSNYVLNKDFSQKRRIFNKGTLQVSTIRGLKITDSTPYLYLGVNDVYLYDDDIKNIIASDSAKIESVPRIKIDTTLGVLFRPLKDELDTLGMRMHDWFYIDNEGTFTITVKVFRKPRPNLVFNRF